MVEYNGASLPDWIRITGVTSKKTMEDRLVELGHSRDIMSAWEAKSVAHNSSRPVAILNSRMDFVVVYQSAAQCERDIKLPIGKALESGEEIFCGHCVIRISRREYNDAISDGVASRFQIGE